MIPEDIVRKYEKLIRDATPKGPMPDPDPLIEKQVDELIHKLASPNNASKQTKHRAENTDINQHSPMRKM